MITRLCEKLSLLVNPFIVDFVFTNLEDVTQNSIFFSWVLDELDFESLKQRDFHPIKLIGSIIELVYVIYD